MSEVLEGIKVLEFGQYIAGPYAGTLLAEQGANVIKIEKPGGDPYRTDPGFVVCNRSKKGIIINLKTHDGQEIARRMAKEADVIIENFRPGVAEKLGINYVDIKKIKPGIIYCSISGFGRNGPYKEIPGWEPLVLSLSTVNTGQSRIGDPVYQNLLVASHYAAILASFYIVMALYARQSSGKGEHIEMSLLKSIVAMQPNILGNSPLKFFLPFNLRGIMPLVRIYQGSDGQWFVMNASSIPFFTAMCSALGHEEWLIDPMFEGAPYFIMPPRNAQVAGMLQSIFYTKTRDEWVEILQKANVPSAPVQSVDQILTEPHLEENDFITDVIESKYGKVRQTNVPVVLSATSGRVRSPSPALGEHTDSVMADLGYSATEIKAFRAVRAI